MQLVFVAPLTALVALCTACATTTVGTLDAAEFRSRRVGAATRVALESDGDDRGFVDIASGGAFVTQLGRQRLPVVHIRLTVGNGDMDALRVPLDQLALEIAGERLRPVAVYGDRDTNATSVVVPPGEVRATDVVFALPGGIEVGDVDSFSLFWGIDLPGDVVRKATLFAPASAGQQDSLARSFSPKTHE